MAHSNRKKVVVVVGLERGYIFAASSQSGFPLPCFSVLNLALLAGKLELFDLLGIVPQCFSMSCKIHREPCVLIAILISAIVAASIWTLQFQL
jgi:hypothetical protein